MIYQRCFARPRGTIRTVLLATLCLCAILTGCLSTARIKRSPTDPTQAAQQNRKTDVPGIPFYVKVGQCEQETQWLQPFYTLTLKKTITTKFKDEAAAKAQDDECKACAKACAGTPPADAKACTQCQAKYPKGCEPAPTLPPPQVSTNTQVLSLSNFQKPEVHNLQVAVNSYNPAGSDAPEAAKKGADNIDALWNTIFAWEYYLPLTRNEDTLVASSDAILIANKSTVERVVDYTRTYYYNTPRPWVGSSQLEVDLDAEQTLTKGTAMVQSQTLSTILSALPTSSVLTSVANAGLGAGKVAALAAAPTNPYTPKEVIEYQLTIVQNAYRHTHTRYVVPPKVPCDIVSGGVKDNYALSIDTAPSVAPQPDANKPPPTTPAPGTTTPPKT